MKDKFDIYSLKGKKRLKKGKKRLKKSKKFSTEVKLDTANEVNTEIVTVVSDVKVEETKAVADSKPRSRKKNDKQESETKEITQ